MTLHRSAAWRARVVRVGVARTADDRTAGIDVLAELEAAPSREIGRRIVLRISLDDLEELLEGTGRGGS